MRYINLHFTYFT